MQTQDFLLEIGMEEIPAKLLFGLAQTLSQNLAESLRKAELAFATIQFYATPRRLAVLVTNLQAKQADRQLERKGPAVRAAFDKHGNPTPALEGFARSCNTTIDNLSKTETAQGAWFTYSYNELGKNTTELLPELISKVITSLPIAKPMQWSDLPTPFIRPVQWLVMLYGTEVIPAKIFNLNSDRITYGHRFHQPEAIAITNAADYATLLRTQGHVIVDFHERQQLILQQIEQLATTQHGKALIDPDLLQEVTGLVEWPVALLAQFDKQFLTVPREALIAAMEDHQKSFPLEDEKQQLLPSFITISNIISKQPSEVIKGNERVMRARLADAKFFYETDCKTPLFNRLEKLKHIIFQAKLGSLYDKSQRVAQLAGYISKLIDHKNSSERAGLLCKADLATDMVNEFPELQGIMGSYYARHDGEAAEVATAIYEHYLPRFSGDLLPQSPAGCAVALADRIDTLVGIFGVGQLPTGDKDPFALRRAALAILRILIERNLDHNLQELLTIAKQNYRQTLPNADAVDQLIEFISDRLRAWYQDQGIAADSLAAVLAVQIHHPLDIDRRVRAVQMFRDLPQAQNLAAANKRVKNLLKNAGELSELFTNPFIHVDRSLFASAIEDDLYQAIASKRQNTDLSNKSIKYTDILTDLATLQQPVDHFFDAVLVMDENERLRNNRLALLASVRELFLAVADISLLQL